MWCDILRVFDGNMISDATDDVVPTSPSVLAHGECLHTNGITLVVVLKHALGDALMGFVARQPARDGTSL